MTFTDRQEKFLEFVKESHGDQVRKYTGEPYWTHVVAVTEIVSTIVTSHEGLLIEVSLGHDLVEDTPTTLGDIYLKLDELGYDTNEIEYIVNGIHHLSNEYKTENYPNLNRRKRKKLECIRLWDIPSQYQTVKYADLIHNSSSILERDPKFAELYLSEKREILSGMNSGNRTLYEKCYEVIN